MQKHVEARVRRRALAEKEPVSDFLFEYYGIRPKSLLRWTPGVGIALTGSVAEFSSRRFFRILATPSGHLAHVSTEALSERRWRAVEWIRVLLENVQNRHPYLGCSGMHEWAMVSLDGEIRHPHLPLRVDKREVDNVVRASAIRCTHFDAFRFFAPASRELNRVRPSHENMHRLEQPGCLHVNMDVLRWALKLQPFVASDIVADAFELALEIRKVDMRASPYDMGTYGLEPIKVETPAGRQQYRELQQEFYLRCQPVRQRLLEAVGRLQETRSESGVTEVS